MEFTQVEYLITFASIIYGFTAAEYFHGWGSLLDIRKFSWRFLLWTILGMMLMVDNWWGSWVRLNYVSEDIFHFLLTLTTPLLWYLIAIVTFPEREKISKINISRYISDRLPKIMFLYFLVIISIIVNNYVAYEKLGLKFVRPDLFIFIGGGVLCILGMLFRSLVWEYIILIAGFTLILIHLINFDQIPDFDVGGSFSREEHIMIFISIVFGYIASVFFNGWGRLIRNFKLSEIHHFHLAWTIIAFLIFIDIWWSTWNKVETIIDSVGYFYLILVQPFIYYFLAVCLFAVLKDKNERLHEKFKMASPLIFFLFSFVLIFNIGLSTIFGDLALFSPKNLFRLLGAAFGVFAIYKNSRKYQGLVLFAAYLIYFVHLMVDEVQW